MTAQELIDQLNKADNKDAEIQCLVWDRRMERDVGYDLRKVNAKDHLIFFELTGSCAPS